MRIPTILTAADGSSYLSSTDINMWTDTQADTQDKATSNNRFPYGDPLHPIPFSEPWPVTRMDFWQFPANLSHTWRNPPQDVILVILKGQVLVEVSTGDTLVLLAGELALFKDTQGQGHKIGPRGKEDVTGLVLSLDT
ncbi:cupin domain-containing protein [uncultured Shewanella sp.]|uniref:cupin domain-containing protein n=1 Tax=uncultured Shewanella sp. TaxID=173975 RepID=UPI002611F1DA|nr:cupin domain-containing protein [uncultured Shewanella sp.]